MSMMKRPASRSPSLLDGTRGCGIVVVDGSVVVDEELDVVVAVVVVVEEMEVEPEYELQSSRSMEEGPWAPASSAV